MTGRTQANHRRWAIKAVARGFAACVYPGADVNDQSVKFRNAYGGTATWGTILSRSWLASRVLDYLLLPAHAATYGIDTARVSISGHSRNGKQVRSSCTTATAQPQHSLCVVRSLPQLIH